MNTALNYQFCYHTRKGIVKPEIAIYGIFFYFYSIYSSIVKKLDTDLLTSLVQPFPRSQGNPCLKMISVLVAAVRATLFHSGAHGESVEVLNNGADPSTFRFGGC